MGPNTATAQFGQNTTPEAIASTLASQLNSGALSASVDGNVISVAATGSGSGTNYPFSSSTSYDTTDFTGASFALSPGSGKLEAGSDGVATSTPVYSYSLSYAANGNVAAMVDSVMGSWNYATADGHEGYDALNRLTSAISTAGAYSGVTLTWSYDAWGNRLNQVVTPTGQPSRVPSGGWAQFNSRNRVSSSSTIPAGFRYDSNGNITNDGGSQYTWDAENRLLSAQQSLGGQKGYVYDAEGRRVAKLNADGTVAASFILGLGGEQVTELDGQGNWVHSNVFAGGQLLATYDTSGLHFHLSDWLGTRRVQTSGAGAVELACVSLPFGDDENCSGSASDATEHHFTGKERDTETGLDYFGARYYASNIGRWMSPDPKQMTRRHLLYPQKWNKYSYVQNSPLIRIDPDGYDDWVVIRTGTDPKTGREVVAGTHQKEWAAAEKAITSQIDSKGRHNTFQMIEGTAATVEAMKKAQNTPDTHVVFVGHGGESDSGRTNSIILANGQSSGSAGSQSMTPGPSPDSPPNLVSTYGSGDLVSASSVALFGCDTFDLSSLYSGTDFTGVQGTTMLQTADMEAVAYVTAGGGQAGVDSANQQILNSSYPLDTGTNVEREQK